MPLFNSEGYPFRFVQCEPCTDDNAFLHTRVYTFKSPDTGQGYVARVDVHPENMYVVKFYCKMHKGHKFKYGLIVNRGYIPRILQTVADITKEILTNDPHASFAMMGSRTVSPSHEIAEPPQPTRRYRLYCVFIVRVFGRKTFEHYELARANAYVLVNRSKHPDPDKGKSEYINWFKANYAQLSDL